MAIVAQDDAVLRRRSLLGIRLQWIAVAGAVTVIGSVPFVVDDLSTVSWWAGLVGLLLGAGQLVIAALTWRRDAAAGDTDDERLALAAGALADQVAQQWHREVGSRRLRHPSPLQLRWESRRPVRWSCWIRASRRSSPSLSGRLCAKDGTVFRSRH